MTIAINYGSHTDKNIIADAIVVWSKTVDHKSRFFCDNFVKYWLIFDWFLKFFQRQTQ